MALKENPLNWNPIPNESIPKRIISFLKKHP
jgi:hypothetical protein